MNLIAIQSATRRGSGASGGSIGTAVGRTGALIGVGVLVDDNILVTVGDEVGSGVLIGASVAMLVGAGGSVGACVAVDVRFAVRFGGRNGRSGL